MIKPLVGSYCHFTKEDPKKPVAAFLDSLKSKFGIQAMGIKYVYYDYLKSRIVLKQNSESDFSWTREKTFIKNFEQGDEVGYLIIQYFGIQYSV